MANFISLISIYDIPAANDLAVKSGRLFLYLLLLLVFHILYISLSSLIFLWWWVVLGVAINSGTYV
ncbi:MAG TPA: hypothetical protein DEF00_04635 [Candidatus Taylorbacteria bacterium]|nr:hypothetical protein [Candidatus Taylorbacteria bacterium]